MTQKKESCQCGICQRSREFRKHLEAVTNLDAKAFFNDLFNYIYEVEEDLECHKIYSKNLKTLYPRIWKECTTIQPLSKDEAEFPEKQIWLM